MNVQQKTKQKTKQKTTETHTEKLKIGLVQINNSFSGAHYFPYSTGLLQAYAQRYSRAPERLHFLTPIYCRKPIEQLVKSLDQADIVAFSLYVWNIQISLAVMRQLKTHNPNIFIICGGPQAPNKSEDFLRQNPMIDLVVHGEGERVFTQFLDQFPDNNWENIPSVSWLDQAQQHHSTPRGERIHNLDEIPSPYLENVFKPLLALEEVREWLVLWETNRGCPFKCTFCDWGSAIATKVGRFDMQRIRDEIDWFSLNRIGFVFCCDANFGILTRDIDIVQRLANNREQHGYPEALSVQNTKNATERAYQVQRLLEEGGLSKGVTLSMQTTDPQTLANVRRDNISLSAYEELQRRFTADRVFTYSDLLLGLPGETYDSFANGTNHLISNGQHNRIQFGNLSVLPNAEMGDAGYQEKHGMEVTVSKILNTHGAYASASWDIDEMQELVIATTTMPREDWQRARTFAWTTALLHFNKVMQMPFIVLNQVCGISYRTLIEQFMGADRDRYPTIHAIQRFFCKRAAEIQRGEPEYFHSEKWLGIWWPDDEYMLIHLATENRLETFYAEAKQLLETVLEQQDNSTLGKEILADAITLNHQVLKLPGNLEDITCTTRFNIGSIFCGALLGEKTALQKGTFSYHIHRAKHHWPDWTTWCREVVWFGNKKGNYMYEWDESSHVKTDTQQDIQKPSGTKPS